MNSKLSRRNFTATMGALAGGAALGRSGAAAQEATPRHRLLLQTGRSTPSRHGGRGFRRTLKMKTRPT